MQRTRSERFRELAERLAKPMVLLAFLFLILVAILLQQATGTPIDAPEAGASLPTLLPLVLALALLWPLFLLDAAVQLLALERKERSPRSLARCLTTALCPPLRLAARSPATGNRIWLPAMGWQAVDDTLRRRLERAFSVPMLLIALLILPVLVIEYGWREQVLEHPQLRQLLEACIGLIWLAFTAEFILMCSIAEKKLAYCREHWIDMAIIFLPLVSLLGGVQVLRLGRLARVKQLSAMARLYRLRGIAIRGYRGLLVLELLDRFTHWSAEKRLEHLQADLAAKEAEVEALRGKIATLRSRLAAEEGARVARDRERA